MVASTDRLYHSMGLRESEFARICELLAREPSLTELGMFAVMWSEHCGYKYSRNVLSRFKRYKESLEGKGFENAGIVDLGNGYGVTMKVESHNHPSAVEPYQGAATGVGGIIRDIFTMGARPIASLNSLRFGPIRDGEDRADVVERNRYLFERVVAGIGGYGNCVGVPTVAGEVAFHRRYSGNPLVNAMSVGLLRMDRLATATAAGPGNPVLYLGSSTGKDGIHGATFASEALDDESDAKRPNVQIGDPFAEKLLIEATLEALETGAIVAIQDMGAAGLTCSTTEMASKGMVGMDVELDLVPLRDEQMSAYEIMLSESQERMLAVAHAGREHEVIRVFQKWGAHAVVVGRVTDDGLVTIRFRDKLEAQVNPRHLTHECPSYSTPISIPEYARKLASFDVASLPEADPHTALLRLLSSPNIGSKSWVVRQYDSQVQTQTTVLPGQADAAVLAPRGIDQGLAVKIDGNGRWVYHDPFVGGQLAVVEAARNVACTGARPVAITDGLNFGNPELPHVYWQFSEAVRGIAEASEALGTPVISGNVSFYNESELGEVLPTPLIGMLGVLRDAESRLKMQLPARAVELALLWTDLPEVKHDGLGASEYAAELHGVEDGLPVAPNLAAEARLCQLLAELAAEGLLDAAHDASEGGIAVALAEMAIVSGCGLRVDLCGKPFEYSVRQDAVLFGELPGRVIVAYDPAQQQEIAKRAGIAQIRSDVLGHSSPTTDTMYVRLANAWEMAWTCEALSAAYDGAIDSVMEP